MPSSRFNFSSEFPDAMPEAIFNEDTPEITPEDERVPEPEAIESSDSSEDEDAKSVETKMLEGVLCERGGTPDDWKRGENWREDYFDGNELFKADRQTSITKELEAVAARAGTTEWLEDHRLFLQHLTDRPGEVFIFPDFTDQDGITHVYVAISDGQKVLYGEYEYLEKIKETDEEAEPEGSSGEGGDEEALAEARVKAIVERVEVVAGEGLPVQVETAEAAVTEDKKEEKGDAAVVAKEVPQPLANEIIFTEAKSPLVTLENETPFEVTEAEGQEVPMEVESQQGTFLETQIEEAIDESVSADVLAVTASGIRLVNGPSIDPVSVLGTKERGEVLQGVVAETLIPVTHEPREEQLSQKLAEATSPEPQDVEAGFISSENLEIQQTEPLIRKDVQKVVEQDSKMISENNLEGDVRENTVPEAANDNKKIVEIISEREDLGVKERVTEVEDSLTEALQELFMEEGSEDASIEKQNTESATETRSFEASRQTERAASNNLSSELAFMMGRTSTSRGLSSIVANDAIADSRQGPRRSRDGITLMAA